MKRILVFCGSSPGRRPEYTKRGAELGRLLAERDLGVVYGGASVGVMGALADGALEAGGAVIGVIPRRLTELEIAHAGLSDLRVVETMHQRKALMHELSDAVIALPGGAGTLDELFELFTWSQLGLHHKPMGLLDVAEYWQPLLAFLDHAVNERFLRAEHRDMLLVERDAGTLVDRLGSFEHTAADKWLDRTDSGQVVPNTRSPASPRPGRM
jgi:uncharacterized protein (TIGR00730 family)